MGNYMASTSIHATGQPASVPPASERYIGELDGVRAVAVGIVVCAHYHLIPYIPGGFGVTLFFFLSGYLITTLFYAEYKSTHDVSIPRFYLRRWLRLTPPLIISIVLGNIFYHQTRYSVGSDPVPIGTTLAALFYYMNYYALFFDLDPDKMTPFGINWSLAIEEHFYLIWPLIIRKNIRKSDSLFLIVLGLCLTVLLWRMIARFDLHLSVAYTYLATDCRIDSILYGALLRILFETRWAGAAVRVLSSRTCQISAILVLFASFIIRDDDFRETIRYSLHGLVLMPLFTLVLVGDPKSLLRRALSNAPMVLIGRLSYSIYLFHLMARTPAEAYFGTPFGIGPTLFGLALTGALAYTIFILVERPLARLRHRFRSESPSERRAGPIATPMEASIGRLPEGSTD